MNIFWGIVLLAISFLFILVLYVSSKKSEDILPAALFGAIAVIFLIAGIDLIDGYYSPSITPIDVYRERTTLEITYRDSVSIDSTVVWKEEIK